MKPEKYGDFPLPVRTTERIWILSTALAIPSMMVVNGHHVDVSFRLLRGCRGYRRGDHP